MKNTQLHAILKNDQCMFASKRFSADATIKDVKEWARGRGGSYKLIVTECPKDHDHFSPQDEYRVSGNRVTFLGSR